MPKLWKLQPAVPDLVCAEFSDHTRVAAQLLYNRGITTKKDLHAFLDIRYEGLHDPFLFHDMKKAVDRIWQAVEKREVIYIYGDYDADAVTANSVLQQMFRYVGHPAHSYIPDRFSEGYGLNLNAFEKIKNDDCTLVITVDCGTNSVDVAEFCKANGIDLIITDHHEIIGPTPNAFALINPKNPNDKYPYHEITGVGVAFKVAQAVLGDSSNKGSELALTPGWEKWLLDLVAIGTVADCHSVMGENRILVSLGLKVLAKTKWTGLRALCKVAQLDFSATPPDTYTLGFIIAPRLNAAGRLEHADIALGVLMEDDPLLAFQHAQTLEAINVRRQDHTQRILSEAREQAELLKDRKFLVVRKSDWSKGVVGLVAGKLVEEYHKPVIVLEEGPVESTGSARTIGDFDVVESLKYASEFLVRFGGHKQAAGLTLLSEKFPQFYQKLLEYTEINLREEDLDPTLMLEAQLQPEDVSVETLQLLGGFEPFGVGNPRPKFLIENARVANMRVVGKKQQHLQLDVEFGNKKISGIYFNGGTWAKILQFNQLINLAAELIEDSWNGRQGVKLRIVDVKAVST